MAISTDTRFWRKVDKRNPNECWEWKASTLRCGYGNFGWNKTTVYAHRMAAFLSGLIPHPKAPTDKQSAGFVLHKCDNRLCCNPAHLYTGTYKQNAADMQLRKRAPNFSGAANPNAVFSDTQVIEIRAAYKSGTTQQKLAATYGVDRSTIGYIVRGNHYA